MKLGLIFASIVASSVLLGCQTSQNSTSSKLPAPELSQLPEANSLRDWRQLERDLQGKLLDAGRDGGLYAELGYVQYKQGRFHAAAQSLEQAVAYAPNNAQARALYASSLMEIHRNRDALKQADEALALNSNLGAGHWVRGRLLQIAGRNQEAREEFQKGWKCDPPHVESGVELSEWDLRTGEFLDAADRLRLCLIHQPDSQRARLLRAKSLAWRGDDAEAARELQTLIDRGQADADAYLQLAEIRIRQGDFAGFKQAKEDALQLASRSFDRQKWEQRFLELVRLEPPIDPATLDFRPLTTKSDN